MKIRVWGWAFLLLAVMTRTASAGDDYQYWQQFSLKPYKSEKVDFLIFSDSRFVSDAQALGLYFFSPRLTYHYSRNLDLGLNYTHIQSRRVNPSVTDESFNFQHRAEVEVNPQWQITDGMKLKMRNRVEFRWIEGRGSDNTRYRQRWTIDLPVKKAGFLKSVYVNSEFFYDAARRNINENRSVPLGLNFKLNDKTGVSVFWMIQSQKGRRDWSSNQILGTLFSLSF